MLCEFIGGQLLQRTRPASNLNFIQHNGSMLSFNGFNIPFYIEMYN